MLRRKRRRLDRTGEAKHRGALVRATTPTSVAEAAGSRSGIDSVLSRSQFEPYSNKEGSFPREFRLLTDRIQAIIASTEIADSDGDFTPLVRKTPAQCNIGALEIVIRPAVGSG